MIIPEAVTDERTVAMDAMYARGATVEDVVAAFRDISLVELERRAVQLNDPMGTFSDQRDSESFRELVRLNVQYWINRLYLDFPDIAARLDGELNPELQNEMG